MKKAIVLLLLVLVFSCKEKQTQHNVSQKKVIIENFDWLLGKWQRTNDKEGKKTFENWHKKSNDEYVGLGFTMQGKDTLSKENMQIINKNKQWKLIVSVVGKGDDTSATPFKMIQKDAASFTFENKEIDFPNTIHYEFDGKMIKATIANNEMSIPFLFEPLKN